MGETGCNDIRTILMRRSIHFGFRNNNNEMDNNLMMMFFLLLSRCGIPCAQYAVSVLSMHPIHVTTIVPLPIPISLFAHTFVVKSFNALITGAHMRRLPQQMICNRTHYAISWCWSTLNGFTCSPSIFLFLLWILNYDLFRLGNFESVRKMRRRNLLQNGCE